jgi:nucleotide-binding universal stress UspA family protein
MEEDRGAASSMLRRGFLMSQAIASHFKPAKILLPIDFSSSSCAALETAVEIAGHFQAEVYLMHVIPKLPIVTEADFFEETAILQSARNLAEQQLSEQIDSLTSRRIRARSHIEVGDDVTDSIMKVIERENIDLVVISTHGMSGWRMEVFGSIAEKVVKLVQCPLLLLRSVKAVGDA